MKPEWAEMFPDDATLLAKYAASGSALRQPISGMTPAHIQAAPPTANAAAGKWTTQQVVVHLADADSVFTHRLKRIIAEDSPAYSAWSEDRFVARLVYEAQSVEDALLVIEANHRQIGRVLDAIGAACLDRVGLHSSAGEQSARTVLKYATWHISHHLEFVKAKKIALGLR